MKPDPYRVRAAVGMLGADNTECALVGDTQADGSPRGEFPRELGSSRGQALQGCVCWRSPRGFPTWAAVDSGVANEHAGECLTYRPAASAAQGRRVGSRRVALMETVDDAIGQKYPTGSQVTRPGPSAHVAKVDHAAEIAVSCQKISRVQVPVQPQRRTCPLRRS